MKEVFDITDRGYKVVAFWPDVGGTEARIVITKDGKPHREFTMPAYKAYNIAAHFSDIVDGEIEKSMSGYNVALSDGLGETVAMNGGKQMEEKAVQGGNE